MLICEDRLIIAERLEQGVRLADIAEELDCEYATVYTEIYRSGGVYDKVTRRYSGYDPAEGQVKATRGKNRKYRNLS